MPFLPPALPSRARLLRFGAAAAPVALVGALLSATPAFAETTTVASSDDLTAALAAIQPDDTTVIALSSDTSNYLLNGEVDIPDGSDVTLQLNDEAVAGTRVVLGTGASLTVQSGTTTGNLDVSNTGDGAAIELGAGATFHVSGASVAAVGGANGAAIGTGDGSTATGATVIADQAAYVTAIGGTNGAGVGGSRGSVPAAVKVLGGATLQAFGGDSGAGIGGGQDGLPGGSLTAGDASDAVDQYNVEATAGTDAAAIGGGAAGAAIDQDSYGIGVVKVTGDAAGDSAIGSGPGASAQSLGGVTVGDDAHLQVDTNTDVVIPEGETLVNLGKIWLDGTFSGAGSIENDGSILPSEQYPADTYGSDPATIVDRVGTVKVKGYNYTITLDAGAGSISPDTLRVLANYVDNSGVRVLPTPVAPSGSTFTSWLAGDVEVVASNPLSPIADTQSQGLGPITSADGTPVAITYTAEYTPVTTTPDPTPTPDPTETTTPTPEPTDTTTPAPVETTTPAPVETTTPAPVETTTPAPVETTPAPVETTTPAPAQEVLTAKAAAVNVSGAKLSVAVKGLTAGEHYTVTVDGKRATSGTAAKRSVTIKVALPKAKHDTKHTVRVVGAHASVSLKVTTVSTSKHLTVTKTGKRSFAVKRLAAGEHVTVKVRGKVVASGVATAKGVFSFTAKRLKKGVRTLVAKGATAKRTDSLKTRLR